MADFSSDISKSIQGLTNIPVGDLATGIQQFSEALKASDQTLRDSNVTGKQFNQILKLQAEANKKHIKKEKESFREEKRRYKEENTLWQRATRQNREHLKVQKAMIKGMTGSTRQMTNFGRAQEKLFGGMKKGAASAAGGIGKLAGKAGALGLVVLALKTIVDKVLEADKILAGMSKTAGVFRDTLRKGWQPAIAGVRADLAIMGVQLQEIAENANAMLDNLAKTSKVNEGFLKTSTLVSKVFGVGAQASAKFFGAIQDQTTITAQNMHQMVESIVQYSDTGTNVARVTRDMVANSNLIAIYGQDQVKNLIEMAKHASDNGTTLEGIQNTMETLGGDYASAADAITEINRRWGVNFNAMEAHQVAFMNDAEAQQKMRDGYIDALAKQHNMQNDNRGLETAFDKGRLKSMKALGITEQEVRLRQVRNRRARGEDLTAENRALEESVEKQRTLEGLLQDQRTIWDKINSIITGPINVALEWIGTYLEENLTGYLDTLTTKMRLLFDGKGLQADLEKGDWSAALKKVFSPLFTIIKNALAEAFDYISDNYEVKTDWKGIPQGFGRKGSSIARESSEIIAGRSALIAKRDLMQGGAGQEERGKLEGRASRMEQDSYKKRKTRLEELQREIEEDTMSAKVKKEKIALEKKISAALKKQEDDAKEAAYQLVKFDNELQNTIDSLEDGAAKLTKLQKQAKEAGTQEANLGFEFQKYVDANPELVKQIASGGRSQSPGTEWRKQFNIWAEGLELEGVSPTARALGWAGGSHNAIVGEAGGEVVTSRSALRSGIGIGGRAAAELASIGVPGYQYGITTAGQTGGRNVRAAQAQAGSRAQNEQLLAYQELVYQDRKNQIERDEANYRRSYKQSKQYQNALNQFSEDVQWFGDGGVNTFRGAVLEDAQNRRDWVGDIRKSIDAYPAILAHTLRSAFGIELGEKGWQNATYTASFAALKAWAGGKSYTQAAAVGVSEGLKKDGVFNKMLVKLGEMRNENRESSKATAIALNGIGMGLEQGLRTFAQTADPERAKEAAIRGTVAGLIQEGGRHLAAKFDVGGMGAYDEQVAKGQQWGQLFDLIGPGGAGSLALSRMESMRRQQGYGQYPGAAKGKYVNSPTLMMVGEEGRGEVVIPTERIRNGMPINKGVANELASIGVPGFDNGAKTGARFKSANLFSEMDTTIAAKGPNWSGTEYSTIDFSKPLTSQSLGRTYAGPQLQNTGVNFDYSAPELMDFSGGISGSDRQESIEDKKSQGDLGGWAAFKERGGFSALGKYSLQHGLLGATNQAVGDILAGAPTDRVITNAATAGIQAGVGAGATALLSVTPLAPIAPILGPLIGSVAGKLAGGWLGKKLGVNDPKFGKYRDQAMRTLKEHMASDMAIEPGLPPGLGNQMTKAIMGRFNKPTANSYKKLKEEIQKNTDLNSAEANAFIKLYTEGKTPPGKSVEATYAHLNKQLGLPEPMAFAEGGIVSGPTSGIVGEAGPEAVIPLKQGGVPRDDETRKDDEQMIREMQEMKKALYQMLKLMGDGKTTINLDGRVLAEVTATQMQTIAAGL